MFERELSSYGCFLLYAFIAKSQFSSQTVATSVRPVFKKKYFVLADKVLVIIFSSFNKSFIRQQQTYIF